MSSRDVTVYAYAGCQTCRKALAWLKGRGITASVVPIVESPPSAAAIEKLIMRSGLPAKKWWNTSGEAYRALVRDRGKEAVGTLSTREVAALLAENGKRIKRPVLVTESAVLVGFDEAAWSGAFS